MTRRVIPRWLANIWTVVFLLALAYCAWFLVTRFSEVASGFFANKPLAVRRAEFATRLNAKFPVTAGAKVAPAFDGWWSVVRGEDVSFVRDDVGVVIRGSVFDVAAGKDLSRELVEANRPLVDLAQLDPHDAVVMGSGSRRLVVFSDPDCPFCRRLDAQLAKLHDVQVWVFPYPLDALHPKASKVAAALWCQADPAAAWRAYEAGGKVPASKGCDNPIERNLQLGQRLGVRGTPTLVFPDGRMMAGLQTAEALEARLAK